MRATTPPMIDGSTFVAEASRCGRSRCASPRSIACARSAAERRRPSSPRRARPAGDRAARSRYAASSPAAAPADRARRAAPAASPRIGDSPRPCEQVGHRGALARHRHGRVQQHLLERRVLLEEIDELRPARRSIASRSRRLLDGDVEERAGVADGGGLVRHLSCRRSQLVHVAVDEALTDPRR